VRGSYDEQFKRQHDTIGKPLSLGSIMTGSPPNTFAKDLLGTLLQPLKTVEINRVVITDPSTVEVHFIPAETFSDDPNLEIVERCAAPVSDRLTRKATYQIDDSVLDALDKYHLQLQMDMGKRKAPYKEIVVEEAIAQWLERVEKSPDQAVKTLLKRQEQRQ
jgi:hypothetical protein